MYFCACVVYIIVSCTHLADVWGQGFSEFLGDLRKSKLPRSQPVAKATTVRCAPESQPTARSDFTMFFLMFFYALMSLKDSLMFKSVAIQSSIANPGFHKFYILILLLVLGSSHGHPMSSMWGPHMVPRFWPTPQNCWLERHHLLLALQSWLVLSQARNWPSTAGLEQSGLPTSSRPWLHWIHRHQCCSWALQGSEKIAVPHVRALDVCGWSRAALVTKAVSQWLHCTSVRYWLGDESQERFQPHWLGDFKV